MATIGIFTKTSDGCTGTVRTLTLKLELTIKPRPQDNAKAPDHRIYADGVECDAGWKYLGRRPRLYQLQARRNGQTD